MSAFLFRAKSEYGAKDRITSFADEILEGLAIRIYNKFYFLFSECPPDFTLVGGSCFLHVTHMATWSGARDLCRDMGAELVTVRTKEEQVNLIDYLRSPDLKSTDINVKAVSAQKGYVPFNRIIEKFRKYPRSTDGHACALT